VETRTLKSKLKKKQTICLTNLDLEFKKKTRGNAIVEHLVYQIPVTQLKGPKGNGDMQAVKRD